MADINDINERIDNNDIEGAINELQRLTFDLAWENIYNNREIHDTESLLSLLEMGLDLKEDKKVKYISWLLNNYYPNFLSEKIELLISEEKYELCAKLTECVKVTEMPTV